MKQFRGKSFLSMKNLSEIAKTAVRRKLFTLLGRFVKQMAVIIISEKKNTFISNCMFAKLGTQLNVEYFLYR